MKPLLKLIGVLTTAISVAAFAVPANAQSNSLPKYLPAEAAGFTLTEAQENTDRPSSDSYLYVLGTPDRSRSIMVTALPAESGSIASSIKRQAGKNKVHGKPAIIESSGQDTMITWLEKGSLFTIESHGSQLKPVKAFAEGVKPTGKPDSSFSVKAVPAGMNKIYSGPEAALIGAGGYAASFMKGQDKRSQVNFIAQNVDPRYFEVLASQSPTAEATTMRGKPAYQIFAGFANITFWMEQPNMLMLVLSSTQASGNQFAEALAPVDEPTWAAAVDAAASVQDAASNDGTTSPPVAAGIVGDIPWGATVRGSCIVFAAGDSKADVCTKGSAPANFLGWNTLTVKSKTLAVGVTGKGVATVVAVANGVELQRAATQPVTGQAGLQYFVIDLGSADPATVTFSGLDAAGAEIAPAIAAKK